MLYIVPMISPDTSWGRWFIGLAGQVRPRGVEPVLLFPPSQAKYLHSVPSLAGLEAYAVYPERYLRFFLSRRGPAALMELPGWLRRLPDFGRVDLIHSTEAYPWAWYGRAVARRLRRPYLFSIRGDYGWIAHQRLPDRWLYAASSAGRRKNLSRIARGCRSSREIIPSPSLRPGASHPQRCRCTLVRVCGRHA